MTQSKKIKPPKMEIRTAIVAEYNGRLRSMLEAAYESGYELLSPPVFSHNGEPAGFNGFAVGFRHPHFLVVVGRKT